MSEAQRSPAQVARIYRELRDRELKSLAERAVGSPVLAAARFRPFPSWWVASLMWKIVVPIVGWGLLARDWVRMRRVDGIGMLAVDGERLYAISPGAMESAVVEPELLHTWDLTEIEAVETAGAGTDDRVTFHLRPDRREFRLYCSSLRTNPWASEVVRRMGGTPPRPIAVTAPDAFADEPTTL